MREKYYMPLEQFRKLETPSLKGTKLNMAVKSLELGGLSSTLLYIHQQVQAVAKFGLKDIPHHEPGLDGLGGHQDQE